MYNITNGSLILQQLQIVRVGWLTQWRSVAIYRPVHRKTKFLEDS